MKESAKTLARRRAERKAIERAQLRCLRSASLHTEPPGGLTGAVVAELYGLERARRAVR